MKIILIILFLFTLNCSPNKVSNNHGFRSLETKYARITINETNKNDIIKEIGPPSSKSEFDENKWIYIERRKTNQSLFKLGIQKIEKNNILVVEFNNMGILKNKKLLDANNMNDIEFINTITEKEFRNNSKVYEIFTSLREKINAPVRNRAKKRKN